MRKILPVIIGLVVVGALARQPAFFRFFDALPVQDDQQIARAYANRQVRGEGIVRRILSDDTRGRRHQRFILALASGQTVLVAHNIDIAPRIEGLRQGDTVAFYGEYEWNEKGGVIHWTHRDPDGRHVDGWLKHNGVNYQ
jgi:hypothetical protein